MRPGFPFGDIVLGRPSLGLGADNRYVGRGIEGKMTRQTRIGLHRDTNRIRLEAATNVEAKSCRVIEVAGV